MNKKGFTLIELLTVIAILGILVLLAAPKFLGYTEQAKLAQIKNDVAAHEKQVSLELLEDPSYLDEHDYDGPGPCMIDYSVYKEYILSKNKVLGKDLLEGYLFRDFRDSIENESEDVIKEILEEISTYAELGYFLVYDEKGPLGFKEIKELIFDERPYHILLDRSVKSNLRGVFIASQDEEVLYVDGSILPFTFDCDYPTHM